jgi:tRNA threonylcarbamoyladenosine biosynthesis protein TsaE
MTFHLSLILRNGLAKRMMKPEASDPLDFHTHLVNHFSQSHTWYFSEIGLDQVELLASALAFSLKALLDRYPKQHFLIALTGQLGAGKTTFCQNLIPLLCQKPLSFIESPTFSYINSYSITSNYQLNHYDLYRLDSKELFYQLDLDQYWQQPGISLIEWPQIILSDIPYPYFLIKIDYCEELTHRNF